MFLKIEIDRFLLLFRASCSLLNVGIIGVFYNYSFGFTVLKLGIIFTTLLVLMWYSLGFTEKQMNRLFIIFLVFSLVFFWNFLPILGVAECESIEGTNFSIGFALFSCTIGWYLWRIKTNSNQLLKESGDVSPKSPKLDKGLFSEEISGNDSNLAKSQIEGTGYDAYNPTHCNNKPSSNALFNAESGTLPEQFQSKGLPLYNPIESFSQYLYDISIEIFEDNYFQKILGMTPSVYYNIDKEEPGEGKQQLYGLFKEKIIPLLNQKLEELSNSKIEDFTDQKELYNFMIQNIHQFTKGLCHSEEFQAVIEDFKVDIHGIFGEEDLNFCADAFCFAMKTFSDAI